MTPGDSRRFWSKVAIGGAAECWPWTAATSHDGYGAFGIRHRTYRAHRLAYQGELEAGAVLRHSCDNRLCCNPAHLLPGTVADNAADMVDRERQAKGSRHGSAKLDEDAVRTIRRRYAAGETQSSLGRAHGVRQTTVSRIVLRTTWRHVA